MHYYGYTTNRTERPGASLFSCSSAYFYLLGATSGVLVKLRGSLQWFNFARSLAQALETRSRLLVRLCQPRKTFEGSVVQNPKRRSSYRPSREAGVLLAEKTWRYTDGLAAT